MKGDGQELLPLDTSHLFKAPGEVGDQCHSLMAVQHTQAVKMGLVYGKTRFNSIKDDPDQQKGRYMQNTNGGRTWYVIDSDILFQLLIVYTVFTGSQT